MVGKFRQIAKLLKHIGRKWCSIPLHFRAELILKSAEMTEIGRTLLFPSQLMCMDSKTRDILSISVILADLRIKSARKSSGMEHHLRPLCCNQNASLRSSITFPSRFRLFIRCGAKVRCRSSRHFGLEGFSYLLVSIQLLSEKAKQKIWSYDAQICLGKLNHLDATNDVH